MGKGTVLGLKGAALRVMIMEPAGASFQGSGGDLFPPPVCLGWCSVPPVSYVDDSSLHCKREQGSYQNKSTATVKCLILIFQISFLKPEHNNRHKWQHIEDENFPVIALE